MRLAVEGRFCDSAISVREAALELVGRHIASHPDVGLKACLHELLFLLDYYILLPSFTVDSTFPKIWVLVVL